MPSIVITSRWMVLFLLFSSSTVSQSAIIQDNGYSDVVIAINDRVIDPSNPLQNYNFIEELKVSNHRDSCQNQDSIMLSFKYVTTE